MSLKEIKRTAALAWSPPSHTSPMLATGTLAGALDASFSTTAELEIYDLQLDNRNSMEVSQKIVTQAPSRFNRIAWSSHNSNSPDGVLVGGCEDGTISFWNASELLSNSENALLARCEAHHGAVRGLQINPFQPFLVASGATDSEIWLWDLNNLTQPYSPAANKSNKLEDITDLAWNRIVPHILATSSNSGYTVIWDLKSRKEVLQLSVPAQRVGMSALAWNPENATQIVVASDDDSNPVIYSWDLRNARAPEKILPGHSKGILSLAWCPKDAELLLSCGKDNRAVCWNPKSGTLIADLTQSDNWLFDVQWCPRNPDLFSTASFSGSIEVHSFQGLMSGGVRNAPATSKAEDFFATANQTQRAPLPAHLQIPKWLRRPIGVSFGFGGRLITYSSIKAEGSKFVAITAIVVPSSEKLVKESVKLDSALSSQMMADYCAQKIPSPIPNLHVNDQEAIFWNVAKIMFESNVQERLLNMLGFDRGQLEERLKTLAIAEQSTGKTKLPEKTSSVSSPKTSGNSFNSTTLDSPPPPKDFFNADSVADNGNFDFGSLVNAGADEETFKPEVHEDKHEESQDDQKPRRNTFGGVAFSLFSPETSEIDKVITKAIILGNFEAAVDLCVKADRLSDALLVAICGGSDLIAKTQQIYFQKSRYPYLRLLSGIVKQDLTDVVENAHIDNWEEILALICSYAKGPTFAKLCNVLGGRAEEQISANPSFVTPSVICYMAAGNSIKAVNVIVSQNIKKSPNVHSFYDYSIWLENLIEKIRVVEQIAGYVAPQEAISLQDNLQVVSDKFIEYAYVMANFGLLDIAIRYYNSFSQLRTLNGQEDLVSVFGDQLSKLATPLKIPIRQVPDPFADKVDIQGEISRANVAAPPTEIPPQASSNMSQMKPSQPSHQWQRPSIPGAQMTGMPNSAPIQPMFPQPGHVPVHQPSGMMHQISQPQQHLPMAAPTNISTSSATMGFVPQHGGSPTTLAPPIPQAHLPAPMIPTPQPTPTVPQQMSAVPQPAPTVPQPMPIIPQSSSIPSSVPNFSFPSNPPLPMPGLDGAQQMPSSGPFAPQSSVQAPRPPLIPQPPRPTVTSPSGEQFKRNSGPYNDPPMVAPRVPPMPSVERVPTTFSPPPVQPAAQSLAPTPAISTSSKASPGPIDANSIPSSYQPIYQTFNNLITQCQARALPMQRRVVEDSARRIQALYQQLINQELSAPVIQILNDMCSYIKGGQYDRAHELHTPLMTSHFGEAGAWVLAAKRLIEVAKICLH